MIHLGITVINRAAGGFCPEAQVIIDAMSTIPSTQRQILINDLVKGLIDDGIWQTRDVLYLTAAHAADSSLLNWINPGTHDLTVVNLVGGQFTVDRGWTGNGVNGLLSTNYNPSTDAINYALNDASFGAYIRTNVAETKIDMANEANSNRILSRLATNEGWYNLNSSGSNLVVAGVVDSRGFFIITGGATLTAYRNAGLIASRVQAQSVVYNDNFAILGSPVPSLFSTKQIASAFAGGGMTQTNVNNFTDRIETFMDAIGAGVI